MDRIRYPRNFRTWYIEDLINLITSIAVAGASLNDEQQCGFDLAVSAMVHGVGGDEIDLRNIIEARHGRTQETVLSTKAQ